MRLAYVSNGGRRFVVVRDGAYYVDLSRTDMAWSRGLTELLEEGPAALQRVEQAVATAGAEARVDAVGLSYLRLNEPGCVFCIGTNYAAHIRERSRPFPVEPSCFIKSVAALVAHGQPIERPANSEQLDYEVELAVVIGRAGRYLRVDQALDYVAGYTIMNDGSVRDFQNRYGNVTVGKNFANSGAIGPELVTADELPRGAHGLRITTRVNGSIVQDSSTADLVFDVAMCVSLASQTVSLKPGDVISTGTPAGVGAARTPPVWLRAGDLVEMFIEGIGSLSNPIVDALAPAAGHGYDREAYAPIVIPVSERANGD